MWAAGYITALLVARIYSAGKQDHELKGSGHSQFKMLSQTFPGETDENRKKPQSGKLVSRSRFKPNILQI
jgi:hypothetical protein